MTIDAEPAVTASHLSIAIADVLADEDRYAARRRLRAMAEQATATLPAYRAIANKIITSISVDPQAPTRVEREVGAALIHRLGGMRDAGAAPASRRGARKWCRSRGKP